MASQISQEPSQIPQASQEDRPAPGWQTASAQGPRNTNADAVATFLDPTTQQAVYALADGIGDGPSAARAAQLAAEIATHSSVQAGPAAAILAAQKAVREDSAAGDCVLVVAMPAPWIGGYRISWVGDARAYSWHNGLVQQLTRDHTLAQYFRDRNEPTTPRMDHVVTTSVRTSHPQEIGVVEVAGPTGLLLTSDGVHKTLSQQDILNALRLPGDSAMTLVHSAIKAGTTDNSTALVIAEQPDHQALPHETPPHTTLRHNTPSDPITERFTMRVA